MTTTKHLGVLTSGGDCAGLNAVIRAVVGRAIGGYGWRVTGIRGGTHGLIDRPIVVERLDRTVVDPTMLLRGGTILGTTNWGDPFAYPMADGTTKDLSGRFIEGYRDLELDALIAVGGDGSFRILRRLAEQGGLNLIGIPKTIDNDVPLTENAVGYATALDVAVHALDRLQPTAESHGRVMVLEVMGRDAGHIALGTGIAGGADVILIPEIPYRIERVAEKIDDLRRAGRSSSLVVVSEAARSVGGVPVFHKQAGGGQTYGGIGHRIGAEITERTGAETRVTVLGHVQRGGSPVPRDRLMATAFGVFAVDVAAAGRFDRMIAWQNRCVVDVPLADVVRGSHRVELDGTLVRTARGLGICLGD
ncbi:MAG: ATP-dependent 6-phosphofructokinase [Alphaproteobacteria bacterium]